MRTLALATAAWLLAARTSALEVDCGFEPTRSMVVCRCIGTEGSTHGFEDLDQIIDSNSQDRLRNLEFRHVEIRDCRMLSILVDLRSFVVDGHYHNISDVSFDKIDSLELSIEDIDYGNKRFVFNEVRFLKLSGNLAHPTTTATFFVRSNPFSRSEVIFQDFLARSFIPLINILDARSVRVVDCYFENLREAEVLRAEQCFVGEHAFTPVGCFREELFRSTVAYSYIGEVVRSPIFISCLTIFLIGILIGVLAFIIVRHWKKKKELELIGYPAAAAAAAATTSNLSRHSHSQLHSSTTRMSSRQANSVIN